MGRCQPVQLFVRPRGTSAARLGVPVPIGCAAERLELHVAGAASRPQEVVLEGPVLDFYIMFMLTVSLTIASVAMHSKFCNYFDIPLVLL